MPTPAPPAVIVNLVALAIGVCCCSAVCNAAAVGQGGVAMPRHSVGRLTSDPHPLLLLATLRPQDAVAGGCDAPSVLGARIAVFYGIPAARIVATPLASCSVQFYFVNATDADYYSNDQLAALLLALDSSYRATYLLMVNISIAGGGVPPPAIDPAPRPPVTPPVQPPVKIFMAEFLSTEACSAFVLSGAHSVLQVSADRLVWANNPCAGSPFGGGTAAAAVFSVSDDANATNLFIERRSETNDVAYRSDEFGQSGAGGAAPMRMEVEAAIVHGLSEQAMQTTNMTSLSFATSSGAISVPVAGFASRVPTVLVSPASTSATSDPAAFVTTLTSLFAISPGSLRVLWTAAASSFSKTASTGERDGNHDGGSLMFSATNPEGVALIDCLLNVSATINGDDSDGNPSDLLRIVLGTSFAVAAVLVIAVVIRRRQQQRRRRGGAGQQGQYAAADIFDGSSVATNSNAPQGSAVTAVNMEGSHRTAAGGVISPNHNANTVLLS